MMSPPFKLFSLDFGHFEINFLNFLIFLFIFASILADFSLFIFYFTCTKKWRGLLQLCPPSSNFSHRIFIHFHINFHIFWIIFFYFRPFYFIFHMYQKKRGTFAMMHPPHSSNFSHRIPATLKSFFIFILHFLPVFSLILAIFILFFMC